MSTRAGYGFKRDGEEKIMYCHCDGYPTGLGEKIHSFITDTSFKEMSEIFDNLVIVNEENDKPSVSDIKQYEQFVDTCIKSNSLIEDVYFYDWYILLRESQGELDLLKKGIVKHAVGIKGREESLEYIYIIDITNKELLVIKNGIECDFIKVNPIVMHIPINKEYNGKWIEKLELIAYS